MNFEAIADIQREIGGLKSKFGRPSDVTIKVGSIEKFLSAIENSIGLTMKQAKQTEPKSKLTGMTFAGVGVVEHFAVPDNMAVVMHGDEIVNIVRFQ